MSAHLFEGGSISLDAEIMGGRACIAGTRIPVWCVLDAIATEGSVEGATEHYGRVSKDQAIAAIRYVAACIADERPVDMTKAQLKKHHAVSHTVGERG